MVEQPVPAIPDAVVEAIGDALTSDALARWWKEPSSLPPFYGQAPFETWRRGDFREVLDFIEASKSGVMA